MKALVKSKPKTGLWMEEVPMPIIGENEVLIKIKKTSICGTDLHIYNWDNWAQRSIELPLIIGHEFMGEIIEMGTAVTHLSIGDRYLEKDILPADIVKIVVIVNNIYVPTRKD